MDYSSGGMQNVLPFVAMVITVVARVTDLEVLKAAMSKGVNKYVIFVYAQALPIPIFLVWSLVICRSSERPPLTLSNLSKIFVLAVFGFVTYYLHPFLLKYMNSVDRFYKLLFFCVADV